MEPRDQVWHGLLLRGSGGINQAVTEEGGAAVFAVAALAFVIVAKRFPTGGAFKLLCGALDGRL